MLVRLLVAVLMLTGPAPVRVCTCAASARTPVTPVAPVTNHEATPSHTQAASETSGCGCKTKQVRSSDRALHDTATSDPLGTGQNSKHSHPGEKKHDEKCPAVNPLPAVSAVPSPAPDASTDYDLGLLVLAEPASGRHTQLSVRHVSRRSTGSTPLYISLLNLRI